MKYLFEEEEVTCVELEKQLGLKRGDIKEITVRPEGAVEVETTDELNPANLQELRGILKSHNLIRGKKLAST